VTFVDVDNDFEQVFTVQLGAIHEVPVTGDVVNSEGYPIMKVLERFIVYTLGEDTDLIIMCFIAEIGSSSIGADKNWHMEYAEHHANAKKT
jgi:hypothetical protein